jgi:O-antigen/teichoic acid export membrane protein
MINKIAAFFAHRDKFYGFADSGLISLFRFASGIGMAQIAGAEGFATYVLLMSTAVIFQMLPTTLFLTPLLNQGNSGEENCYITLHRWAKRGILRAALLFSGIGTVVLLLLPQETLPIATGLCFLAAASTMLLQQFLRARLQLEFKQRQAFIADCATVAIHIGCSLSLWKSGLTTQSSFWLGACIASLLGSALMRLSLGRTSPAYECNHALLKTAASSGRVMLIGSIANTACSRFQPFVIGLIANTSAIAQYGVAWTLIGPIRMLSMALTSLLRPRLSRCCKTQDRKAFQSIYHKALLLIAAAGGIGILASFFVGNWTIAILFGDELSSASKLLPLALLYATLDAMTTSQMVACQIGEADGPARTSKLRVHAAIISLLLLVPMTYALGLYGTLGSLIIAELYYAVRINSKNRRHPNPDDVLGSRSAT